MPGRRTTNRGPLGAAVPPRIPGCPRPVGFGFDTYASDRYEPSVVKTGNPYGTPEECFDCAALTRLSP